MSEPSEWNVVNLMWVPGHHGIEDNEQADKLARKGTLHRDSIHLKELQYSLRNVTKCGKI